MENANFYTRVFDNLLRTFMVFVLCLCVISCDKDNDEMENLVCSVLTPVTVDFSNYANMYPLSDYEVAVEESRGICMAGKSIAYIGGSIASLPESDIAKSLLYFNLENPEILTYGKSGNGFSTSPLSFQDQVRVCKKHDVYILWCSTNDFYIGVPQGCITDYTEADGWDETKLSTLCGGMNYCIDYLRNLNPESLIVGFTSLPFFGVDAISTEGYMVNSPRTNGEGMNFYQYISVQQQIFERQNIPYLNQWDLDLFSVDSYLPFYKEDGVHFTEDGYFLIGCAHLKFLAELLKKD